MPFILYVEFSTDRRESPAKEAYVAYLSPNELDTRQSAIENDLLKGIMSYGELDKGLFGNSALPMFLSDAQAFGLLDEALALISKHGSEEVKSVVQIRTEDIARIRSGQSTHEYW